MIRRCADCAWGARDLRGQLRCVAASSGLAPGPVLAEDAVACEGFEPPVDCATCGACCREAFDSVPVGPEDEPTALAHPALIRVAADGWRDLLRVASPCGTRCAALAGDGERTPYRCAIYADRPSACRELDANSWNCLFARRRVGLSTRSPAADR